MLQTPNARRLFGSWGGEGGYGKLLRIAGPLILSTATHSVQMFVDRMFLSWYSPASIAAAMPAGMLSFALFSLFIGTAGYATTFVAQYSGAGMRDRIGPVVWQGMYVAAIGGIFCTALAPASGWVFRLIGHAPAVQELEAAYLRILCLGAFFPVASTALGGFFSGRGKVWPVMWINVAATAVNVTLNYLLIFGVGRFPEMGIRGAAVATVASQAFAFGLYLTLILRRSVAVQYCTRRFRLDVSLFRRLLRFGVPSGIQYLVDFGGFTVFLMVVGRIGTPELAATNIAFNINSLAFMPMLGLGMAVNVLVGQYIGDKRPGVATTTTWNGFRMSMLYMGSIAVLYVTIPGVFAGLFAPRNDRASFEAIRSTTVVLLRFVALYSLLREKPVQAGLVVLGEMTIQGNILPVRSLVEPLQLVMDNGAKRVLLPLSNRRQFMEIPPDIVEKVDMIFYSEPLAAALKALGIA